MAVPKKHTTKSHRDKKRMHIFLKAVNLITCSHCGKPVPRHVVCKNCGYYKGKEVLNVLGKLEKKERKAREKEIKSQEKEQKKEQPMSLEELSKKQF